MKYTALRQLSGNYGVVGPGQVIEIADEKTAEALEARGLIVRGSKKLTDSVLEKAAERAAESQQAEPEEKTTKATGPKSNK
jgi:hypothetical protein